jgi:tRNA 2-thiouridine synthesizing protein B
MLHVLSNANLATACLLLKLQEDVLLLIEEAVTAYDDFRNTTNVYALEEDLLVRGLINDVPKGINLVNYTGFVDLVINHSPVQCWY